MQRRPAYHAAAKGILKFCSQTIGTGKGKNIFMGAELFIREKECNK
jgi:hypothetical protein